MCQQESFSLPLAEGTWLPVVPYQSPYWPPDCASTAPAIHFGVHASILAVLVPQASSLPAPVCSLYNGKLPTPSILILPLLSHGSSLTVQLSLSPLCPPPSPSLSPTLSPSPQLGLGHRVHARHVGICKIEQS